LDISALRTLYYSLNNNGILERLSFRFYYWVGLGSWDNTMGWAGSKIMDPRVDQLCDKLVDLCTDGIAVPHGLVCES